MHSPIRVAVFDTCPLYRMGVVQAIARCSQLLLVAEGATAAAARCALRDKDPHVLLLNISTLEGIAGKPELANSRSECKIAVLTARDDPLSVSKALATGAAGYILKAVTGAELVQAIETIDAGKPFITPELASRLLTETRGGPLVRKDRGKSSRLSYREQQMLDHASQGLTNHEIAAKLGLKVGTIKHYMTSLYKKMKATNRLQAIQASKIMPGSKHSEPLPQLLTADF
jgi:two-component system, NarL family, nitrate/nitrite response regulator NarL